MADIKGMLADPEFQKLSPEDRVATLEGAGADPKFVQIYKGLHSELIPSHTSAASVRPAPEPQERVSVMDALFPQVKRPEVRLGGSDSEIKPALRGDQMSPLQAIRDTIAQWSDSIRSEEQARAAAKSAGLYLDPTTKEEAMAAMAPAIPVGIAAAPVVGLAGFAGGTVGAEKGRELGRSAMERFVPGGGDLGGEAGELGGMVAGGAAGGGLAHIAQPHIVSALPRGLGLEEPRPTIMEQQNRDLYDAVAPRIDGKPMLPPGVATPEALVAEAEARMAARAAKTQADAKIAIARAEAEKAKVAAAQAKAERMAQEAQAKADAHDENVQQMQAERETLAQRAVGAAQSALPVVANVIRHGPIKTAVAYGLEQGGNKVLDLLNRAVGGRSAVQQEVAPVAEAPIAPPSVNPIEAAQFEGRRMIDLGPDQAVVAPEAAPRPAPRTAADVSFSPEHATAQYELIKTHLRETQPQLSAADIDLYANKMFSGQMASPEPGSLKPIFEPKEAAPEPTAPEIHAPVTPEANQSVLDQLPPEMKDALLRASAPKPAIELPPEAGQMEKALAGEPLPAPVTPKPRLEAVERRIPVETREVDSQGIKRIGYSESDSTLEVTRVDKKSGKETTYQYHGVTPEDWGRILKGEQTKAQNPDFSLATLINRIAKQYEPNVTKIKTEATPTGVQMTQETSAPGLEESLATTLQTLKAGKKAGGLVPATERTTGGSATVIPKGAKGASLLPEATSSNKKYSIGDTEKPYGFFTVLLKPNGDELTIKTALTKNEAIKIGRAHKASTGGDYYVEPNPNPETKYSIEPNELGFYSQLERAVDSSKQETQRGADWLKFFKDPKRGVKSDELKWTGLDDILASKSGERVTKQQILDHLKENEVRVEEFKNETPRFSRYVEPGGKNYREVLLKLPETKQKPAPRDVQPDKEAGLKWGTDWNKESLKFDDVNKRIEKAREIDNAETRNYQLRMLRDERSQIEIEMDRIHQHMVSDTLSRIPEPHRPPSIPSPSFTAGHFDEQNVLAHLRLNDRVSPDGKKTLFVEEIQSDWGQKGKRGGFSGEKIPDGEIYQSGGGVGPRWHIMSLNDRTVWFDSKAEAENYYKSTKQFPSAPFVTSTPAWTELAIKRILKMAADEGYDRVSWTTGAQQAERYDLAKQVSRITYEPIGTDKVRLTVQDLVGDGIPIPDSNHGIVKMSQVEDILGKEIYEKIKAGEGEDAIPRGARVSKESSGENPHSNAKVLSGLDLKVGGEGMNAYYDQMVPQGFDRIAKKFGAKSGKSTIDNPDAPLHELDHKLTAAGVSSEQRDYIFDHWNGSGKKLAIEELGGSSPDNIPDAVLAYDHGKTEVPVHSIDITPEMRSKISKEGFSQFKVDKNAPAEAPTAESIKSALPKWAQERASESTDGVVVKLPNGKKVTISGKSEISDVDYKAIEQAYGKSTADAVKSGNARVYGETFQLGDDHIVNIVESGEIPHELAHIARTFATAKENAVIEKTLAGDAKSQKKSVDEVFADGFKSWREEYLKDQTKPRNVIEQIYKRIYDFFNGIYRSINPNVESVYKNIESGKIFERGAEKATGRLQPGEAYSAKSDLAKKTADKLGPKPVQASAGPMLEEANLLKGKRAPVKGALEEPVDTTPRLKPAVKKAVEEGVHPSKGAVSVSYSIESLPDTSAALREFNAKSKTIPDGKLEKYISDLHSIAAIINRNDALQYVPERAHTSLKPNQGERNSVDFTTSCKRRKTLADTIAEVQRLQNSPATRDQIIDIRVALAKRGIPSTCGPCFVEGKRLHTASVLKKALDGYTDKNGVEYPPLRVPRELILGGEDSWAKIKTRYPDEYAKLAKIVRMVKAKVVENRTDYRSELLSLPPGDLAYFRKYGLRFNSWSDMELPSAIDLMQVIGDASAQKLPAYGYTKEPNFVKIAAPSGMFINMSLIPEGSGLRNGKLLFNENESFPLAEMREFRSTHPHVGNELIGINDAQIKSALASPDIDYVIPVHFSGQGAEQFRKLGLKVGAEGWNDYTKEQGFKDSSTGKGASIRISADEWEGDIRKFNRLMREKNLTPPFERMASWKGYEKLLADRRIYGPDGKFMKSTPLEPDFNMPEIHRLLEEYRAGDNSPIESAAKEIAREVARDPKRAPLEDMIETKEPPLAKFVRR